MHYFCSSLYNGQNCEIFVIPRSMIFVLWQKGLKRVCDLAMAIHSALLAPMCAALPVFDELCRHSAHFINICLSSD